VRRSCQNACDSTTIVNAFELQPLERRVLFAVPTITKAMRQELVSHWTGSNKAELQAKLDANKPGAFDGLLLNYMATRSGNTFFWNTGDVAGIRSFVNEPNIEAYLTSRSNDCPRYPTAC